MLTCGRECRSDGVDRAASLPARSLRLVVAAQAALSRRAVCAAESAAAALWKAEDVRRLPLRLPIPGVLDFGCRGSSLHARPDAQ